MLTSPVSCVTVLFGCWTVRRLIRVFTSGIKQQFFFVQPMEQSSLKNSDVLILTGLTQIPTANPDGMLGEFCSNLGESDTAAACYVRARLTPCCLSPQP